MVMKLNNRVYGSQFSEIEKEITFNRENMGYVSFIGNSKRTFKLNPSPFTKTRKREIFTLMEGVPSPIKNHLIEVTVDNEIKNMKNSKNGWTSTLEKYISDWKIVNPNSISKHRRLLDPEEVIEYYKIPYVGDEDIVHDIGMTSALYSTSAPPFSDEVGGINAAVLGNKKHWDSYYSTMNSNIPSELMKYSSEYYFRIAKSEEMINLDGKTEVSRSYFSTKKTPMQMPIILDIEEVKGRRKINELSKTDYPVIQANLIDSLLMHPLIPNSLYAYIKEKTYQLKTDFMHMGKVYYNQDFGSAIEKMALSYARFQSKLECSKKDIDYVYNLWNDMQSKTEVKNKNPLSFEELYGLKPLERTLYEEIFSAFGTDFEVSRTEVRQISRLRDFDLFDALDSLNYKGCLLKKSANTIILLDK